VDMSSRRNFELRFEDAARTEDFIGEFELAGLHQREDADGGNRLADAGYSKQVRDRDLLARAPFGKTEACRVQDTAALRDRNRDARYVVLLHERARTCRQRPVFAVVQSSP